MNPQENNDVSNKNKYWQEVIPFSENPVEAFPSDALPTWMREYVEAIAEATQTPPDLAGMLSLTILSTVCARRVEVQPYAGWEREPVNIYTVLAMESGSRKSPVFRELTQPLREHEKEKLDEIRDTIGEALTFRDIKEDEWETAKRLAAREQDPVKRFNFEQNAVRLGQELQKLQVPQPPRLIADDVTPEKLSSLMAANDGRIAVLSAEGGIFGIMEGRYSDNGPNYEIFLKGYSGDSHYVDRQGRDSEVIERPAITLGLTVQPAVIQGLQEKRNLHGKGLLSRMFFVLPPSMVGRRNVCSKPIPEKVREAYKQNIEKLMELLEHGGDNQAPSFLLSLDSEAEELLLMFSQGVEEILGNIRDDGELLREWVAKIVGGTVRIASLLHMAANVEIPKPWEKKISAHTLMAAKTICEYLTGHAIAAFSLMGADPGVEDAKFVIRWIQRKGISHFTRRDLFIGTRSRFKRVGNLIPVITLLREHNYIREVILPSMKTNGRPSSESYEVNPDVHAQKPQNAQNITVPSSVTSASSVNDSSGVSADETENWDCPEFDETDVEEGVSDDEQQRWELEGPPQWETEFEWFFEVEHPLN